MKQSTVIKIVSILMVMTAMLSACRHNLQAQSTMYVKGAAKDSVLSYLLPQSHYYATIDDEISIDIIPEGIPSEHISTEFSTTPPATEVYSTDATPSSIEPPVHTHQFILIKIKEATCTRQGTYIYKCDCGTTQQRALNALGHNYTKTEAQNSTYVSSGWIIYSCTRCGTTKEEIISTLPSTADSDMCGNSLVEKPLKHAPYTTTMQDIFDIYHSKPHIYEPDSYNLYCLPMSADKFTEVLFHPYQYFWYACTQYFIHQENGTYFNIYYDEDSATKNETAYQYAQQIIRNLKIDSSVTQKEAIIRINEWICNNKYYDTIVSSSLYYSLFEAPGVCHNYALAFQILCLTAGIECHYYSSKTMNHAWNKIYFSDDSYLWVDVTWNDVDNAKLRTKYLLIDDNMLLKDHTW